MKKTLCIFLAAILILTMTPLMVSADPVASEYYNDVYLTDPYYDAAMYLYHQNIMRGTSTGVFSPNANVTRAMAVTMLWRMAGKPDPDGTPVNFVDCPSTAYYYPAVQWASFQMFKSQMVTLEHLSVLTPRLRSRIS